jgi:hypothetical protein
METTKNLPARIYRKDSNLIDSFFTASQKVSEILGTNTTKIVQAINGIHYWVHYEFNKGNSYLKFTKAKKGIEPNTFIL